MCTKFVCWKDRHFKTQPGPVVKMYLKNEYTKRCARGCGFNSQLETLKVHFSQLVPVDFQNVYLYDTRIYYTLYFNFHLLTKTVDLS